MSRIGNRPIKIDEGVEITVTPKKVTAVFGDKKSELFISEGIKVGVENGNIIVRRSDNSIEQRSLHGLTARLVKNIVTGVKDGFKKELEFKGTGYRASVDNGAVILNMGYSHEIKLEIPENVNVQIVKNNIIVTGEDKQKVGSFAAQIRNVRGPEVYKGKGIKYKTENIKRKAGKKAAA